MAVVNIKVGEMLGISTISYSNTRRFGDIKRELNKYAPDDEIILDFKYVGIQDTRSNDFKDLVTDKRVKFIIYNDKDLQDIINFIAIMASDNVPEDKVTLIENNASPDRLKLKVEKEVERYLINFDENSKFIDGTYYINVEDVVSFIDRDSILDAIFTLIDMKRDEYKKFIINLGNTSIATEQIKILAKRISSYVDKLGGRSKFDFYSGNSELTSQINTFVSMVKQRKLTPKERADVLLNELGVNTAGILTTFVSTGKKDMFGRTGNGEIATTLPCKFIRIQDDYAIFKVFKLDTFMTKADYSEMHDNEELVRMESYIKKVPLSELGICNYCIGKRFHFNLPVQWNDKDGCQQTFSWHDGGLRWINITLPQFFMMVFDCWGEKYNYKSLVDCIRITKNNLRRQKDSSIKF